jgi:uncharacterized protein YqeY
MSLMEQINDGIKDAMRSKETIRLSTLRMLKSKILAVDARGNLSDAEVVKLFKTYLSNLQEALEQAVQASRTEIADTLRAEVAIVQEFLPQPLSEEETAKLVTQAIVESGAKTKKDLGLVMKAMMKLHSSVDGKLVKKLAEEALES